MATHKIILWFRQDLRTSDNPALFKAAQDGDILPVYILDDHNAGAHKMGAASRWWLHHSLKSLNNDLGGMLRFYRGDAAKIIKNIAQETGANAVYWNRCYEPWRIARDSRIKEVLRAAQINVQSFNGSLLWEPWEISKTDGTPYKVFTPFYRKGCLGAPAPRLPLPPPEKYIFTQDDTGGQTVDDLDLLPKINWDAQLAPHWHIGETAAQQRLLDFVKNGLRGYKEGRNFPARRNISRLSPYLHFGEISPNTCWYAALGQGENADTDCFNSELGWREFSHYLLYHFPELPQKNWNASFDAFAWENNEEALYKWQRGKTGIPIVDAGMRELWQTGYMHNRVRMIVASFLIKNLMIDWREGANWFWDCLVDADLANNSASWQWVAGCGADAAPYFRIFNPVTQGQKFDPEGAYTRHYVPEIAALPEKYLFAPWEAPEDILRKSKITLGQTYPRPIVDLKFSRERALTAFKALKS